MTQITQISSYPRYPRNLRMKNIYIVILIT